MGHTKISVHSFYWHAYVSVGRRIFRPCLCMPSQSDRLSLPCISLQQILQVLNQLLSASASPCLSCSTSHPTTAATELSLQAADQHVLFVPASGLAACCLVEAPHRPARPG